MPTSCSILALILQHYVIFWLRRIIHQITFEEYVCGKEMQSALKVRIISEYVKLFSFSGCWRSVFLRCKFKGGMSTSSHYKRLQPRCWSVDILKVSQWKHLSSLWTCQLPTTFWRKMLKFLLWKLANALFNTDEKVEDTLLWISEVWFRNNIKF